LLGLVQARLAFAEPVDVHNVRAAMASVESLLRNRGIDVSGYQSGDAPPVELVPGSHPNLQGADGGYVDGRVYLNGEALASCTDLTLLHELVHDVSVKRRLFASVGNSEIRPTLEALADQVTADAAQDPYRPGCLPHRRFAYDAEELARMASAGSAAPSAENAQIVIPVFFTRGRARLSPSALALIVAVSCRLIDRSSVTVALVENDDVLGKQNRITSKRAKALQRALARLGVASDRIHISGIETPAAKRTAIVATREGIGRGLIPR